MTYKILKIFGVMLLVVYAILWAFSFRTYDTKLGISYSPLYARHLGLDHDKVYDAILSDLKPSTLRLAVPWNTVEMKKGKFDFKEIDTMLKKAAAKNIKVILTIGQKVPRWPECYIPTWVSALDTDGQKAALLNYVKVTVERYKGNSAIELWQIENEPFINFTFGECAHYNQSFVVDEVALVRKLDPSRKIVLTDSGELSTYRLASREGDILGTTLYRTVRMGKNWTWRYDWLPPSFYVFKSRLWGNDSSSFFISELQAEPWFAGADPSDDETLSADSTFNLERFAENVSYANKTGASRVYLWGVEWWYYMKVKSGDDRYWDTAKKLFN